MGITLGEIRQPRLAHKLRAQAQYAQPAATPKRKGRKITSKEKK